MYIWCVCGLGVCVVSLGCVLVRVCVWGVCVGFVCVVGVCVVCVEL